MTRRHRIAASLFLMTASLAVTWNPVRATELIRGPYLQMAGPDRMTLRWRTDESSTGLVSYGLQPGALTQTSAEAAPAFEHEVVLTGLTPSTVYHYRISEIEGTVFADGPEYRFRTSPVVGSTAPFRIWAIGDAGTRSPAQLATRNAYLAVHDQRPADFMMMLGDNAYDAGMDEEYQGAVFDMYPMLLRELPLWSCIGNHETYSNPVNPPYYDIFTFPTAGECGGVASGTEHYYSFDYANVHFIALDSMQESVDVDGPMVQWLIADLQANVQPWTVAFWHHPPYTKGTHNSDFESDLVAFRESILPWLEKNGVDLVLCGHSHVYERSWYLNGHYGYSSSFDAQQHIVQPGDGQEDGDGVYVRTATGPKAGKGAVYVVAGSAGQAGGGSLNHPAFAYSFAGLGTLIVDVADKRLDVAFLRETGAIDDHFTIVKGDDGSAVLPGKPAQLAALDRPGDTVLLRWEDVLAEDGYSVWRSDDGETFTQIGTTGPNISWFEVANAVAGQTLWLRVTAQNANGSAESDVVSYTVPQQPSGATRLQAWRFRHFGTLGNAGAAANGADPDADGLPNLLEFGVDTHPRRGSAAVGISSTAGGGASLSFPRQALPELTYIVETSTTLSGPWTPVFSSIGAANVAEVVNVPITSVPGGRNFARLRIELAP